MKKKVLFLIVVIIGILATANLVASSGAGARGKCADSSLFGCRAFCKNCYMWYKGTSGRNGPGIVTRCSVCGATDDDGSIIGEEEDFEEN